MMIKKVTDLLGYTSNIEEVLLNLYQYDAKDTFMLVVTINRKNKLNAVNPLILDQLIQVFQYFKDVHKVRAIIITGSGSKAFIAGADIATMSKYSDKEAYDYSLKGQELVKLILFYNKPVIAAINGYALGGGCEISLACHLRYASNNACFGQPEVKLGIIAGWGGTQNLPRIVGLSKAVDLLISGRIIDAKEALKIGLINDIIESKNFLDEILNRTVPIIENSPNAIMHTINSIYTGFNHNIVDAYKLEAKHFMKTFSHNDSKVGLKAFMDKCKPDYD